MSEGRLVRVILLAICCDHPAMVKMAGFADHGHSQAPCPKCTVTKEELFSNKAIRNGTRLILSLIAIASHIAGFARRDPDVHRGRSFEWKNLESKEAKHDFFTLHGVRWTEFARLPYFDLIRCAIIDPMHNLLLGTMLHLQNLFFAIERGSFHKKGIADHSTHTGL